MREGDAAGATRGIKIRGLTTLRVGGQGAAVPIYRVVSGPGQVVHVFTAADDDDAGRFVHRLASHSPAGDPCIQIGCLRVESQSGGGWRRVYVSRRDAPDRW